MESQIKVRDLSGAKLTIEPADATSWSDVRTDLIAEAKNKLRAELELELGAAANEDDVEAIRSAFSARERRLEHDVDSKIHTFSATVDVEVRNSTQTRNSFILHAPSPLKHVHPTDFCGLFVRCSQYKCASAAALQRASNVRMPPMHRLLTVLCVSFQFLGKVKNATHERTASIQRIRNLTLMKDFFTSVSWDRNLLWYIGRTHRTTLVYAPGIVEKILESGPGTAPVEGAG